MTTLHTVPRTAPPTLAFARWKIGIDWLRLPFDCARARYAQGVNAGWIQRSMLAARDFERALGAMEQATLGPLARRV